MCDICVYAAVHGSWPATIRGTHCSDCHRSWAGFREAHCPVCCQHFSADSVAEKHRVNGKCLSEAEMLVAASTTGKRVFRRVATPSGFLWRNAETLRLKPAFTRARAE